MAKKQDLNIKKNASKLMNEKQLILTVGFGVLGFSVGGVVGGVVGAIAGYLIGSGRAIR